MERSAKPWEQQNKGGDRNKLGGSRNPNVPDNKKKQNITAHGIVGAVPSADRVVLYINEQNNERGANWVAPKKN